MGWDGILRHTGHPGPRPHVGGMGRHGGSEPRPQATPAPSAKHPANHSLCAQRPQALHPKDKQWQGRAGQGGAGLATTSVCPAASPTTRVHPAISGPPQLLERWSRPPLGAPWLLLPAWQPLGTQVLSLPPRGTHHTTGKKTNHHQGLRGLA